MVPVSPVMPGSESIEILLGKDQPEYSPLPAVYLDNEKRPMITRWRLSSVERAAITCRMVPMVVHSAVDVQSAVSAQSICRLCIQTTRHSFIDSVRSAPPHVVPRSQ